MFKVINQKDPKKLMTFEANIFDARDQASFNENHIKTAKFLSDENFAGVCEYCNKSAPGKFKLNGSYYYE